jgi:hypothetical protein
MNICYDEYAYFALGVSITTIKAGVILAAIFTSGDLAPEGLSLIFKNGYT